MSLIIVFCFSSCTLAENILEKLLYPYKKPKDFDYFEKDFKLDKNSDLKTENFYFTKGEGVSGEYYEYFKFDSDGTVYYYGGTISTPENCFKENYIDIERKKNGVPKYRKTSWGRYNFYSDSLKLNIVNYTALSSNYKKYLGTISNDTLFFDVYNKDYTSEKYIYSHSDYYIYYSGDK